MDYHFADICAPPENIANSHYAAEFVDTFSGNGLNPEYHELTTGLADGGDMFGVSSVAFDRSEELFWMGNQGGHVTSYYGPTMQKYTSFQVHATEEVRSLLTIDPGILILTKSMLRHQIRRGIPKFTYKSPNMVDMQCLLALDNNRLVMGGHQDKLIDFDLTTLKETKQHSLGSKDARCAILRQHSYMLVAGDPSGRISLRDPGSLRTQHVLDTHTASLSDLDVQGNFIVTCGFGDSNGGLQCDCFLLVYDIRALRPLPPLSVCLEPLLLRFLPSVSSRVAAVSSHGQVQLVDTIRTTPRLTMFQGNTQNSECLSFDIASTSQAFVFGDQSGHLHLFSPEHNTEPNFNSFSRATEFADTPEELPFVRYFDETFPLSSVPLPPLPAGQRWLSHWPEEFARPGYRMPKPIDSEVLKTMKMQGPIGYAPNPRNARRNEMPYILDVTSSPNHSKSLENNDTNHSLDGANSPFIAIPKRYRKVEVRYTKLGPNDFDFEHYNKTGYPGLEATLPNSYCNAMLQVLYYTPPVKRALLRHTCSKEFCLSCELGFLFRMLDTSSGAPCQASNFLRAFRTVPEASALGLILSDRNPEAKMKANLASLIQSWNRFILHQMHYEILATRRREHETRAGTDSGFHSAASRLSALSISGNRPATLSGHHPDPFREDPGAGDFVFDVQPVDNDGETLTVVENFKKKVYEVAGVEAEEEESFVMMQDEGKYMWLSPSALAAVGDPYDPLDADSSYFDLAPEDYHGMGYGLDDYGGVEELNLEGNGFLHNFVPDEMPNESYTKKHTTEETDISRLFGTKQLQIHRCLKCKREEHKESIVLLTNLQYPHQNTHQPIEFTDILKNSLCPRKVTPAWCEGCRIFSPTSQSCSVRQLPKLLAINCNLSTPADKQFWQKQTDFAASANAGHPAGGDKNSPMSSTIPLSNRPCRYGANCSRPACRFKHPDDPPRSSLSAAPPLSSSATPSHSPHSSQHPWLPHEMVARLSPAHQLTISRTEQNATTSKDSNNHSESNSYGMHEDNGLLDEDDYDEFSDPQPSTECVRQYSLSAVVCHVEDTHKNIVSMVRVGPGEGSDRAAPSGQPQWFLFNDFCVNPIPATEVTRFSLDWKVPCVVFYSSGGAAPHRGRRLRPLLTPGQVFGEGTATANFTPLASHEMPKCGELVGMDAEFVTLNQEEAELRSDGRLSTIRPSHLSVARITCVRGQGPLEGTPFIDDYISTQEQVVDYLTKFSGIQPGDLDANFSSKHLTTLKSTYQKLRCLVDTGAIFVGHGLQNDFRVINLVVPPEQVIDTVQLFHLPHHRMVSLKFLAWHLLDIKIQSDTHDSIEDARTALQLYRRYLELEEEGSVASALTTLYETGKLMQWKVPED